MEPLGTTRAAAENPVSRGLALRDSLDEFEPERHDVRCEDKWSKKVEESFDDNASVKTWKAEPRLMDRKGRTGRSWFDDDVVGLGSLMRRGSSAEGEIGGEGIRPLLERRS